MPSKFQSNSDPIIRMVTTPLGVQANPSNLVHSSYSPICHLPEPQTLSLRIASFRPTSMENTTVQHRLVGSHSIRLLSYGSPSQGDPENMSVQLPHNTNSPRLAMDAWF